MFTKINKGEKTTLRPYQKEDISAWQRWDVDEDVQRYMPEPKNMSVSDEEQLAYLEECREDPEGIYWSIVWNESQKNIGTISLTDINRHHGVAEFGVVMGEKEFWGKGAASEAVQLALNSARSELCLRRITAEYEEGNEGVRHIFEKNGFQQECVCVGSRVKDGRPLNTVRFFILLRA